VVCSPHKDDTRGSPHLGDGTIGGLHPGSSRPTALRCAARLDEQLGNTFPAPCRGHHRAVFHGCESSQAAADRDRKSTRLNSSHVKISYAVFCLKKKKN